MENYQVAFKFLQHEYSKGSKFGFENLIHCFIIYTTAHAHRVIYLKREQSETCSQKLQLG